MMMVVVVVVLVVEVLMMMIMMMMTNITGQVMTYNIAVAMFPLFIKSVKEKPWCYNPSGYVVRHKKLCSQWFPLIPYSV